jgi:hypothetical protein
LLSILGAVLIFVLVLIAGFEDKGVNSSDRLFITGIFISCCLLGISFALRPNWIARFTKKADQDSNHGSTQITNKKRKGHHPDCPPFQDHIIESKRKVRCAGCTGLAVSSILSILLSVLYFIFIDQISTTFGLILIILGLSIITLNFLETVNSKTTGFVHLISNIFLVWGFFLVIIGTFHLTGSLLYGTFAVVISILWMDTRIQLSKWRHGNICRSCSETCKAYPV